MAIRKTDGALLSADSAACGKFELYRDEGGNHRFRFTDGARTLLKSRAYKSRQGCAAGIAAVRVRAADAKNFAIEPAAGGRQRLKLVTSNRRVLGLGPCRVDVSSDRALVQRLAADAPLHDRSAEALHHRRCRSHYRIYAAPRNAAGVYQPADAAALIVRGFVSAAERQAYWERHVRPVSGARPGARYEYVMCDYPVDGRWCFVSERRYADAELIRGNL